jgi:hypothetical protein
MNKSLFIISAEAQQIASALEETGELNPAIEALMVFNQNELQDKAINYGYAIKTIESDVNAIDEEIKRLQALKRAKTNAIDRMKESVVNAMNIYGFEKITSPTLNLSLRRSESVDIINNDQLPDEYRTVKTVINPDKIRIKEAIKSGKTVEGAVLVENYSLQIK